MIKQTFSNAVVLLMFVQAAFAQNIVISTVFYDPLGSEAFNEAIELYNPTADSINVSGWVISTKTSAVDATLPEAVIESRSYYLIADEGWSSDRENSSWPEADYEEKIILSNSDSGVAIKNSAGVVDAVGWGDPANILDELYEGTPHPGTGPGKALIRKSLSVDTGNNSNDFIATVPDFNGSSFASQSNPGTSGSGNLIKVIAVVESSFPVIESVEILTDDEAILGVQVHPIPKRNKTVEVRSVLSHANGNGFIESVELSVEGNKVNMTKKLDLNTTSSEYEASFEMNFYDEPGSYEVSVNATDTSGVTAESSADFEYMTSIALEIDVVSLQFRAVPGTSSEIHGDSDEATDGNLTLINIGNSVVDVKLSATDLTGSNGIIDAGSIMYTFNGDYGSSMAGNLSPTEETERVGIPAAARQPLSFRLDVPTATAPGNYTGTITLIAVGK